MATNGAAFENSTEVLDGNEYDSCEFRNCRLVYRGGPLPHIVRCHFANCEWAFEDAAERTIAFLKLMLQKGGVRLREVVETSLGIHKT
jgi:hypothetical protein